MKRFKKKKQNFKLVTIVSNELRTATYTVYEYKKRKKKIYNINNKIDLPFSVSILVNRNLSLLAFSIYKNVI
jgi:hypothetical protein